jgi:pimeloyl-ACP methyl ester carboxylesterase
MPTAEVDGIRIDYRDEGGGEPAFLCLTGWCSSKERFDQLVPLLARRRRTLAFDWRGHGASQRDVPDFGQEEMVRDALATIETAGVERVIPVAASHSGWVAIEVRRRLGPERVPRVVHMDWMVLEPPEPYMALIGKVESEDTWSEARDTLFRIWRAGVESPEIDRVIDGMNEQSGEMWMRSGREIAAAYERGRSPLAAYEDLDPSPTRVLHLYGQGPSPEYLQAQQEFAAAHPWFQVETLPATTHFAMVETAQEAAAAIDRFVADA